VTTAYGPGILGCFVARGDLHVSITSREVHLVERPDGLPAEAQFRIVETEVPDAADGEVLVRNVYMSVDPAMRPPLTNGQTPLNKAMGGGAIGKVVASRNPSFEEGQYVQHRYGFREYFVSDGKGLSVLDPTLGPLTCYMHVFGGTGFTAYGGLLEIGQLKDGENVFVSAAAGAVGSVACQIAKIKDCFVIGSAGSDEKCEWLKEIGVDVAINYKKEPIHKALKAAATNGIDVYFDNVGGDHLNAALPRMNVLGRIPVCGMISAYNNFGAVSEGVTMLANMIYGRVTMRGFVVSDFVDLREQFLADMSRWVEEGRMKYRETILEGIDNAPKALIGLFTGLNIGKMLVKLSDE
jgi:NADPH-dependent curcumin reductase CurA